MDHFIYKNPVIMYNSMFFIEIYHHDSHQFFKHLINLQENLNSI